MLTDLFTLYNCSIVRIGGSNVSVASYRLKCGAINLDQSFSWSTAENLEMTLKGKIPRLIAVLANGSKLNYSMVYDSQSLLDFIDEHFIILTPEEKLNSILEYISNQTSFDGETIEMPTPHAIKVAQMYFFNAKEWQFYLQSAVSHGIVNRKTVSQLESGSPTKYLYSLTVDGLSRLIKASSGKESRECFVAMAFDNELNSVYTDVIEIALARTGFKPIRVDKVNIPSDKTINDEIIAGIKKSRFTIADFTNHKDGVYFEAGYALGRGKKVIYTCRCDQIGKAHFDIRNYQHIVWDDIEDFREKLINKINAFIKE